MDHVSTVLCKACIKIFRNAPQPRPPHLALSFSPLSFDHTHSRGAAKITEVKTTQEEDGTRKIEKSEPETQRQRDVQTDEHTPFSVSHDGGHPTHRTKPQRTNFTSHPTGSVHVGVAAAMPRKSIATAVGHSPGWSFHGLLQRSIQSRALSRQQLFHLTNSANTKQVFHGGQSSWRGSSVFHSATNKLRIKSTHMFCGADANNQWHIGDQCTQET